MSYDTAKSHVDSLPPTPGMSFQGYGMFGFCLVLLADYIQPGACLLPCTQFNLDFTCIVDISIFPTRIWCFSVGACADPASVLLCC